MNFTRRVDIARHGFESVTLKLAEDYDDLKAVCAKHGIEISATRVRKVVGKLRRASGRRRPPGGGSSSRRPARCCASPRTGSRPSRLQPCPRLSHGGASTTPQRAGGCSSGVRARFAGSSTAARRSARARAPERRPRRRLRAARLEALLCLSLFGPQPYFWFWFGSQVQYWTDSSSAGIATVMAGTLASLMVTVVLGKRVDNAWKLVRRAAGYKQERGALEVIFAISVADRAWRSSAFWFFIIAVRGPRSRRARHGAARLLQAVRGRRRGGAQQGAPRASRAREAAGARAGSGARPVEHRVARAAERRGRQRVDLYRARAGQRLPEPPCRRRPRGCSPSAMASSRSGSSSATAPPSCCRPPL